MGLVLGLEAINMRVERLETEEVR